MEERGKHYTKTLPSVNYCKELLQAAEGLKGLCRPIHYEAAERLPENGRKSIECLQALIQVGRRKMFAKPMKMIKPLNVMKRIKGPKEAEKRRAPKQSEWALVN